MPQTLMFPCAKIIRFVQRLLIVTVITTSFVYAKSPGQDALDEGAAHYKQGNYTQARTAFGLATERDPGLVRAWENLGWSHYQLGEAENALRIWGMVLKIEPDNIGLLNESGILHAQQGGIAAAVEHFSQSLAVNPAQPNIHLRLGDIYAGQGAVNKAIVQYRSATLDEQISEVAALRLVTVLEQAKRSDEATRFLVGLQNESALPPILEKALARLYAQDADRHYDAQRYTRAGDLYRAAIRLDVDQDQYRVNLGWALRRQNRNAEAVEAWRGALQVNAARYDLYRSIADAYSDNGDKIAAQLWYQKSAENGADSPGVLLRLADNALENKQAEAAVPWLRRLLAQNDLEPVWWLRVANAYQRHGANTEGIAFLNEYTGGHHAQDARSAISRLYAARAADAYRNDELRLASDDFLVALDFDSNNMVALRDLGWTYWRMESWNRAEIIWKQLAAEAPDNVGAYNLLTQLYLRIRRPDAAIDSARKSLALISEQPDQRLRLAKALYLSNRFNDARSYAKQLASDYPENFAVQYFWGELLFRFQDFKNGKEQWRKVLQLDTSHPRAQFFLIKSSYELGEYDVAIAQAEQYLQTHGPHLSVLKLLAEDAFVREDRVNAIRWYTALVDADPQQPVRWLDLARQHFQVQEYEQSIAVLNRGLAVHPGNLELVLTLADNVRANGDAERAIEHYRLIANRYPGNRRAYTSLLYTLAEARRYEEARDLLKKNRRSFLKDYEATLALANILSFESESPVAVDLFDQAIGPTSLTQVVPILLYHGLSDHARSVNLNAALFDDQMAALKRAEYTPVTVRDFDAMRRGEQPFPARPILITFDDARRDSLVLGDTVLQRHGMSATMFVPTARIVDEHPFFADWPALRAFNATGRWDMQSHGHHAHDPLPLDANGNTGSFLVNRSWLEESARLETTEEYTERIAYDHEESKRLLNAEVANLHIVAYAYPFSEAGQESVGNEPFANGINEDAARAQFTYAFIQDSSGFNVITLGETAPVLMRRFAVPRNWNGQRLLAHLAKLDPRNASRIAKGQSLSWQGLNAGARTVFRALDAAEPALAEKTKYYLATTSNNLGLTRDAAQYFSDFERVHPVLNTLESELKNKIMWNNRPRIGLEAGTHTDSNDRQQIWSMASYTYPWTAPIDVWVNAGYKRLSQSSDSDLNISQAGFGVRGQLADTLTALAEIRARKSDADFDSTNVWLNAAYQTDYFKFQLAWSSEDVDTVPAYLAGTQLSVWSARYVFWPSRHWTGTLFLRQGHYDDDNNRSDARASIFYRLQSARSSWSLGAEGSYSDTDFESALYYTPVELRVGRIVLRYKTAGQTYFPIEASVSAGYTLDDVHDARTIANADLSMVQQWSPIFRTALSADYYEAPAYRSTGVNLSLDYRF